MTAEKNFYKNSKDDTEPNLSNIDFSPKSERVFDYPSYVNKVIKLDKNKTLSFHKTKNDGVSYGIRVYDDFGTLIMKKLFNKSQVITFPNSATMIIVYNIQNMRIEFGRQPSVFTIIPTGTNVQTSYQKLRNKISIL